MITFVNCASVKWATRMHIVFTVAKMVAIAMVIVTGLVRLGQGELNQCTRGEERGWGLIGSWGGVYILATFDYNYETMLGVVTCLHKSIKRTSNPALIFLQY